LGLLSSWIMTLSTKIYLLHFSEGAGKCHDYEK
jgi:hypothetical protein